MPDDATPAWVTPWLIEMLPALLRGGESDTVEFMRELPRQMHELAKEIAALSTSGGGIVLLGVEDDGALVGLEDCEDSPQRDKLVQRVQGLFSGPVKPPVKAETAFGQIDRKTCMAIRVPPQPQPIYYARNVPYLRNLREARPATPDEVIDLVRRWIGVTEAAPADEDGDQALASLNSDLIDMHMHADMLSDRTRFLNPWLDEFGYRCETWSKSMREHAREVVGDPVLSERLKDIARLCDELTMLWLRKQYSEEPVAAIRSAVADVKAATLDSKTLSLGAVNAAKEMLERGAARAQDLVEQIHARRGLKITDSQREASDLGGEMLHVALYPLGFLEPDVLTKLRTACRTLAMVDSLPLRMDGGVSLQRIQDAVEVSGREVSEVVASWKEEGAPHA